MKKGSFIALLAGGAAVAGAAWYLSKKKKETEQSVLYSEEFEEATEAIDGTPIETEVEEQAE